MNGLFQDVRYALRQVRKSPGFTAVAVITLALGIGATTAIYSVLYATLLEPLPFPHPEQLVMVWSTNQGESHIDNTAADFLEWKRQATVFQNLNANISEGQTFNLAGRDRPEQVRAQTVTPDQYRMMGLPLMLGRTFLPEEGTAGKEHVTLLTYTFWNRHGADANIIGKQLRMNGEPYTVVGVFAPGPLDRIQFDIVVPLVFQPDQIRYGYHWLFVMGRLKPGVTIAQAQAEMDVIARNIAQEHADTNKGWGISVEPLHNDFLPDSTKYMLWVLLGAVGFVLLIACVNVANLLLARSTVRQREIAVRVSLGASRGRVVSQFLTESVVLSLMGGIAGIVLAEVLVKLVLILLPDYTLPSEADVRISIPVLLFTTGVSVVAGVLFGSVPAWQGSGIDPNRTLKEGGNSGTAAGRKRLRQVLVVGEFSLALTLLAGAGLSIRSFWNLAHRDLGVRTDHILTFSVPAPEEKVASPQQIVTFYRELTAKLQNIPGVLSAQASTAIPVSGRYWGTGFLLPGEADPGPSNRHFAAFQVVSPGYFETFGIQMVQGRRFTEGDDSTGQPVAMVNEAFVKRYFPNDDPLARRVVLQRFEPGSDKRPTFVDRQIVGVFRNVRNSSLRDNDVPELDVPLWQIPQLVENFRPSAPRAEIAVRTLGDPTAITKSIAGALTSIQSDLPVANVKTMDQVVESALAHDRFSTVLYGTFASLALLLAAVGIYGVMNFMVAQRTHEIGLRMAVGAGRVKVVNMILREGFTLAAIGLLFGTAGAYGAGRVLRSMLYGVSAVDFLVLAVVACTLLGAAVLATYLPARRAANVDPVVALRYE